MPKKSTSQVTLGDLASEAGVSRATVSRALKDNPVISKAVRERIQKLAEAMGYRPDPEAARLMSYLKSNSQGRFESVIGLLNAYGSEECLKKDNYTAKLIAGAVERAEKLGYSIDLLNLGETGMSPRRIDQIIAARGIRGVLIPPEPTPLFETKLDWSQIASVATTTTAQPLNLHRVLPHNFENIRLLLDRIIEKGHRRVGLITWDDLEKRQMSAAGSIYGLYAHIEKRIEPLDVHHWNWKEPESEKQSRIKAWIEQNQPEVILGFGSYCIDTIAEATGMQVPADLSFVSYGDSEPHLSRIGQDARKIGAAAIDLLSAQIQRGDTGLPETPKTTLIEGHFVEGNTLK